MFTVPGSIEDTRQNSCKREIDDSDLGIEDGDRVNAWRQDAWCQDDGVDDRCQVIDEVERRDYPDEDFGDL